MSASVSFDEPFKRLLTQGMVLKNGAVMSKSKGNVVDPDDMLAKYGADALRLLRHVRGAARKEVEWSDAGLEGSFRFLMRVWRLVTYWAETIGGEGISEVRLARLPPRASGRCDARRTRRSGASPIDIEERMHLNTAVCVAHGAGQRSLHAFS